jgi:hypothetical protein
VDDAYNMGNMARCRSAHADIRVRWTIRRRTDGRKLVLIDESPNACTGDLNLDDDLPETSAYLPPPKEFYWRDDAELTARCMEFELRLVLRNATDSATGERTLHFQETEIEFWSITSAGQDTPDEDDILRMLDAQEWTL